ncbi:uncharacterized protein LOC130568789 [Triplophysa rosa]|nr:uncharacterized protein LOC130568789 [Triplophysa rosa]
MEGLQRGNTQHHSLMDTSCSGRVGWETLCNYMLQNYKQSGDSLQAGINVPISQPLIRHCTYNKREPIIRILAVDRSPPMRYISISKGGTLAVWNSSLNITKQLRMCAEPSDKTELGRCCITDGIYMANVHKIAVATMSRGIHFFDVATTNCFEQFHLFEVCYCTYIMALLTPCFLGLNHFATALSYWYDKEDPGEKCVLMWGDESGSVNLFWFLQPSKGLFETKFTKQTASVPIFMPACLVAVTSDVAGSDVAGFLVPGYLPVPFIPEVQEELTKTWHTPFLARTSYTAAGQAASELHAMAILHVHQTKALNRLDEGKHDSAVMQELRTATDLALQETKVTVQVLVFDGEEADGGHQAHPTLPRPGPQQGVEVPDAVCFPAVLLLRSSCPGSSAPFPGGLPRTENFTEDNIYSPSAAEQEEAALTGTALAGPGHRAQLQPHHRCRATLGQSCLVPPSSFSQKELPSSLGVFSMQQPLPDIASCRCLSLQHSLLDVPLSRYLEAWLQLPNPSQWLVRTIRLGYTLQFVRHPPKFRGILFTSVRGQNAPILRAEVEPVPLAEMSSGLRGDYFIVNKKSGGLRPIQDLRTLNKTLHRLPFRMLTQKHILTSIRYQDWFVAIDLKDTYFHVSNCIEEVLSSHPGQARAAPHGQHGCHSVCQPPGVHSLMADVATRPTPPPLESAAGEGRGLAPEIRPLEPPRLASGRDEEILSDLPPAVVSTITQGRPTELCDQCRAVLPSRKDISAHSELITFQNIPHIHNEPINRIMYEHHGELIITSSESTGNSVVIIDVHQKRQKYTWRIKKGVKCFDFSSSHSLLVTAGVDPAVRMWNRYVTSQPIAVLRSHKTNVVDVVIHQAMSKIFSYAKDSVLNIWDIPSQQCVKTIELKFPHFQAGGVLEHGTFPLLLSLTADPALLVTCREYLAMLRLHKTESKGKLYTCALYSPHLKQVITACADSSLAVWDVKTGLKKMEIRNAHGMEKISCITLDRSQRRLISAATNGTIKVWNALNGHNLHKLEAVSNTEVTGIICHHDNQLIATGWSRLIAQYNIAFSNDTHVKADLSWKPGCQHSEDILAMDHCPSLGILATGSYDGEIIIWNMSLQRSITRLQRSPQDKMGPQQRLYPPVHRLLFLQRRAQKNVSKNSAVLLSSQAGSVCWWSIYGPKHKHGQFYVPGESNKSVMGLSSDQENGLLVTGDTTGSIKVWDISQYALSAGDECATELPPLLHSWRGHEGALVSSEILAHGSRIFVLTVSVDCRACLWTIDGGYVGCFGQEEKWDISNPDTYQISRIIV